MKIITKVCLYDGWLCSDNVGALDIYLIFLYDRTNLITKGNNTYIKLSNVLPCNINVDIVANLTVFLCAIFHYPNP